jgi:hypothetical protein
VDAASLRPAQGTSKPRHAMPSTRQRHDRPRAARANGHCAGARRPCAAAYATLSERRLAITRPRWVRPFGLKGHPRLMREQFVRPGPPAGLGDRGWARPLSPGRPRLPTPPCEGLSTVRRPPSRARDSIETSGSLRTTSSSDRRERPRKLTSTPGGGRTRSSASPPPRRSVRGRGTPLETPPAPKTPDLRYLLRTYPRRRHDLNRTGRTFTREPASSVSGPHGPQVHDIGMYGTGGSATRRESPNTGARKLTRNARAIERGPGDTDPPSTLATAPEIRRSVPSSIHRREARLLGRLSPRGTRTSLRRRAAPPPLRNTSRGRRKSRTLAPPGRTPVRPRRGPWRKAARKRAVEQPDRVDAPCGPGRGHPR